MCAHRSPTVIQFPSKRVIACSKVIFFSAIGVSPFPLQYRKPCDPKLGWRGRLQGSPDPLQRPLCRPALVRWNIHD